MAARAMAHGHQARVSRSAQKVRFAADSPVERAGFELPVPRGRGFGFAPVRNQRFESSSLQQRVSSKLDLDTPSMEASERRGVPGAGTSFCSSS